MDALCMKPPYQPEYLTPQLSMLVPKHRVATPLSRSSPGERGIGNRTRPAALFLKTVGVHFVQIGIVDELNRRLEVKRNELTAGVLHGFLSGVLGIVQIVLNMPFLAIRMLCEEIGQLIVGVAPFVKEVVVRPATATVPARMRETKTDAGIRLPRTRMRLAIPCEVAVVLAPNVPDLVDALTVSLTGHLGVLPGLS